MIGRSQHVGDVLVQLANGARVYFVKSDVTANDHGWDGDSKEEGNENVHHWDWTIERVRSNNQWTAMRRARMASSNR
jgi:hypothetical protein